MAGENFWINEVLITGKCIFQSRYYFAPLYENYSFPQAAFFRKSILISRKEGGNYGLKNYCKGIPIRIPC